MNVWSILNSRKTADLSCLSIVIITETQEEQRSNLELLARARFSQSHAPTPLPPIDSRCQSSLWRSLRTCHLLLLQQRRNFSQLLLWFPYMLDRMHWRPGISQYSGIWTQAGGSGKHSDSGIVQGSMTFFYLQVRSCFFCFDCGKLTELILANIQNQRSRHFHLNFPAKKSTELLQSL